MKRITEAERARVAFMIIDEHSSCAAIDLMGKKKLKHVEKSFNIIYEIAHTMVSPRCRKNHPSWTKMLDKAVMEFRRKKQL